MSETKGLYDKYMVVKVVDGTVIENCFILRPDKDPAAVTALWAYAAATENKVLASDLFAWVGKPMQKPLTLEELHALIDAGTEVVTYCESKDIDFAYASIWVGDIVIDGSGHEERSRICFESYGKIWRAWAQRPTNEERAAAPWEGAGDADL